MIINNQPQASLLPSVDSGVSNASNQPSASTNGSAASNVLEFAASASNPQPSSTIDTHSSLSVLLNSLRQLLGSFTQSAASQTPATNTSNQTNNETSNETRGVQASSGESYADSLASFEFSNMLSPAQISRVVNATDTLSVVTDERSGEIRRLTFRPESIPQGASPTQRSQINDANTADLTASLQLAADTGIPLTVSGRVTVTSPIDIVPTENLTVNASGGTFVAAEGLDGDMIRIFASASATGVEVDWDGGVFDISGAQTARNASPHQSEFLRASNPDAAMRRRIENRQGTSETTDGLSIIGVNRGNQNQGIESANINDVRFISLPVEDLTANFNDLELSDPVRDSWREAGGDSAIFLQGLNEANVTNSEFFGSRDAAVYFSASPPVEIAGSNPPRFEQSGSNYSATGNTISNAFDGLTSKRGADSINFSNNTLTDVVIGLSIKETAANTRANDVTFDNNTITRSSRAISLEDASDVTVTNNTINELGRQVAGDANIRNSTTSRRAEGIALEGVVDDINISGNTINRSNSDGSVPLANSSNIVGIVLDDFDSSRGPDVQGRNLSQQQRNSIVSGNTFNGFTNNADRLRNEV